MAREISAQKTLRGSGLTSIGRRLSHKAMRAGLKPRPYTRRRQEQYSQKRTARNGCSTKKKDVRRGAEAPMISSNSSARLKSRPAKEKTVEGAQPGTAVPLSWRQRDSQEWLSHWERSGCSTKKKDVRRGAEAPMIHRTLRHD